MASCEPSSTKISVKRGDIAFSLKTEKILGFIMLVNIDENEDKYVVIAGAYDLDREYILPLSKYGVSWISYSPEKYAKLMSDENYVSTVLKLSPINIVDKDGDISIPPGSIIACVNFELGKVHGIATGMEGDCVIFAGGYSEKASNHSWWWILSPCKYAECMKDPYNVKCLMWEEIDLRNAITSKTMATPPKDFLLKYKLTLHEDIILKPGDVRSMIVIAYSSDSALRIAMADCKYYGTDSEWMERRNILFERTGIAITFTQEMVLSSIHQL